MKDMEVQNTCLWNDIAGINWMNGQKKEQADAVLKKDSWSKIEWLKSRTPKQHTQLQG